MALFQAAPSPLQPGQRLADDDTLNAFLSLPSVSVTSGQVATGVALADAVPMTSAITQFATVAANTGGALAALIPGQYQDVYNDGASPLTVYARSGYLVDGAASVPLANAKRCRYTCIAPGVIESAQLGAVSA